MEEERKMLQGQDKKRRAAWKRGSIATVATAEIETSLVQGEAKEVHIQSSVGTVTLPLGVTSVTVTNPYATPNSHVVLTPQGNPGSLTWVTTLSGSFTIHREGLLSPRPQVTISYLIINEMQKSI
jgi:hypothetical protein